MHSIRPYRSSDHGACRALWVELTEAHRRLYDNDTIGGDDPGKGFDTHLASAGADNLWVAEDAGTVIGLTGLLEGDDLIEIEPLVVATSHRRTGVGTQLIEFVKEEARRRGITLLSVRAVARNGEAITLYREMGFNVLGMIEMFIDLTDTPRWNEGETLAGQDFLV